MAAGVCGCRGAAGGYRQCGGELYGSVLCGSAEAVAGEAGGGGEGGAVGATGF